jgi:hypothetical protein
VTSPMPMHTTDVAKFAVSTRTVEGFLTAAKVIGLRTVGNRLIGRRPVATGGTLIGQLLHLLLERAVPVWLNSPMLDLNTEGGRVTGVVVDHAGRRMRIGASRGVVLAAGGFAHNAQMRQEYHPHPITTD